jgi:hypothetical protein
MQVPIQPAHHLPWAVQLWLNKTETHLPYFLGCWGFLSTASFHTAILRTQEQLQLPVSGAQEQTSV